MPEVLLLARGNETAVARRIESQLQALGAKTHINTGAFDQGRLTPSLKDALRLADAVVLLLTPADESEPWWQDALVDAIRGVESTRIVPVLLGERAVDNLIWPIVADRSAISIPDLGDVSALLRFLKSMLEPQFAPPTAPPTAPRPFVAAGPQAGATSPVLRTPLLSQAKTRLQQAIGTRVASTVAMPLRAAFDDPASLDRQDRGLRHGVTLLEAVTGLELAFNVALGPRASISARTGPVHRAVMVDLGVPSQQSFAAQIDKVLAYAELREDRAPEIVVHAEEPFALWEQVGDIRSDRRPATRDLLESAVAFAGLVRDRLKHAFGVPRPIDWSMQVMPLIASPAGGSYPMGAAVETFVVARLLEALTDKGASAETLFRRLAHRMSENRIVAGLNFPVDAVVGRAVGLALGEYLLSRCGVVTRLVPVSIDVDAMEEVPDFSIDETSRPLAGVAFSGAVSPALAYLWARAREEWPPLRVEPPPAG